MLSARARKLKIQCYQGCHDKRAVLDEVAEKMGISLDEVAFMGNDVNDLSCLSCVALPIVVKDAHPDVVSVARYRTISPGGCGAVREICDLFERALAKKPMTN